uniref:CD248 molecule, endosialin a n=1 Tax=Cyclopterus lumpus TaxID=8103 RepID=A0A8C3G9J9_CYCLU
MGYSTQEQNDNFKWLDGSCSVSVDGYLCHYAYKGMCPALWSEGAGNALYTTPFNLLSTLLTHLPFGSVAALPCPAGTKDEQSVLCVLKDDGSVAWSRDSPLCSDPPTSKNWCDQNNGGCEHFCRPAGAHIDCECADGYQLGENGKNCELSDVCQRANCEFECLPLSGGYRCACPEGYMLAPDERGCLDVDECLQSPCEQLCVNAPGTFECRCREGYHPDDEGDCEDIDECVNDPCEHACENTQGSHICHCHLGFSPVPEDPSQCQDTDECQIPGTCEKMCVNYEGGFECYCEEGYELMSDHYSCRKRGEGDDQSAVTPPFAWVTHQPGPDWLHWGHRSESDLEVLPTTIYTTSPPTTIYTTSPPTTSYSTIPDWYEDDDEDEEETTTAFPFLSSSTVSEGAWNWWAGSTTSIQKPGNPEDSVIDLNMPTDSSYPTEAEKEHYTLRENSQFPKEELGEEENDFVNPSPSEDRGQSSTWLLVGLLVPICIFIVVMVALGIVYCTRCAVHSRNKNATDCYHWISGAHDKQGAPNPSAGVKTHV